MDRQACNNELCLASIIYAYYILVLRLQQIVQRNSVPLQGIKEPMSDGNF